MALFRRIGNLFSRAKVDGEIDTELRAHIDLRTADNMRAGMSKEEARRDALVRFGSRAAVKERTTANDAALGLESLGFDLKYALRQLIKSPGFSLTVVLTLALGIGANAAIFSVVNAVLRHPAGVDHPEQVAAMHTLYSKFTLDIPYISAPTCVEAASLSAQVEACALEQPTSFNLMRAGEAEHIAAARVSWQWFHVFGAQAIAGRTFTPEEDQPHAGPVVVLSYGFWQRAFGGQPDAIGQTLLLDGQSYRVVGVMRSDFAWPRGFDIWVPIALPATASSPDEAFNEYFYAMIRLRPGVTVQQFNAALSTKMWNDLRRLGGARYATSSGWGPYANPVTEFAAGPLRKPLYVLMAVVALVLLIAAANVAGLFLARSSARGREFAIQMALGASPGRMVRQLFLETLLLAMVACMAGIAAGPATGKLLLRVVPDKLAAGFEVGMGWELVVFALLAATLTLLIAGLGPAWGMMRRRGQLSLREGETHATASGSKQRLRGAFVIGEVAAAFLLLAGTGLFLASLMELQQVDPGFDPRGVMAAQVPYAGEDFKNVQPRQAAFVGGVVASLAAQPGVRAAAAVEPVPFDPQDIQSCSFGIVGRPLAPGDPGPHSQLAFATPDYLKVMQIPMLAGRWFASTDTAAGELVAVVDERLAKKYWPNASPIGQKISFGCSNRPALVVGEVRTIRISSLEEDTSDGMRYYPFAQGDNIMADFLVRTDGDAMQFAPAVKQAVAAADSSQAVSLVTSLDTLVADSLAGRRLIVWMLGAFAALALLLASIGIYGLISYVTGQRTQEVGIRMALGAQRGSVLRLILNDALARVAIGLVIGVTLSVGTFALVRHLFADFGAGFAPSFGAAAVILLLVGTAAGLIPAARAASLDPMKALRRE